MALNPSQSKIPIQAAKAIADFLPTFWGDTNQLESFINRCDNYENYGLPSDNNLNDFTYNVICSKLRDNVSNFLMCRPDLTTGPSVRKALRYNYRDRIDRQTLNRDFIHLSKFKNENILFFDRLKQMKFRVDWK